MNLFKDLSLSTTREQVLECFSSIAFSKTGASDHLSFTFFSSYVRSRLAFTSSYATVCHHSYPPFRPPTLLSQTLIPAPLTDNFATTDYYYFNKRSREAIQTSFFLFRSAGYYGYLLTTTINQRALSHFSLHPFPPMVNSLCLFPSFMTNNFPHPRTTSPLRLAVFISNSLVVFRSDLYQL